MKQNMTANVATITPRKKKKLRQDAFSVTFRRMRKNKLAMVGLVIIAVVVFIAIFAPFLAPFDPNKMDAYNDFVSPGKPYLFGTDELGRDILSRMIYGARLSLFISIIGSLISTLGGLILGAVAGYFGGFVDNIIMRIFDVIQAVPILLLAIAMSLTLGPGMRNVVIACSISYIPAAARLVRASVMEVREKEFIEAAIAANCSPIRVIVKHILPNSLSPLIVYATMNLANIIILAASMSFVGIGVEAGTAEWGAMLSTARPFLRQFPYMMVIPGIAVILFVLAFNLLGDALRDALDPKLKN